MRGITLSLLIAAPALVSAAVAPLRKRTDGFGTWYFTQTGNAYVTHTFPSELLPHISTLAVLAARIWMIQSLYVAYIVYATTTTYRQFS